MHNRHQLHESIYILVNSTWWSTGHLEVSSRWHYFHCQSLGMSNELSSFHQINKYYIIEKLQVIITFHLKVQTASNLSLLSPVSLSKEIHRREVEAPLLWGPLIEIPQAKATKKAIEAIHGV